MIFVLFLVDIHIFINFETQNYEQGNKETSLAFLLLITGMSAFIHSCTKEDIVFDSEDKTAAIQYRDTEENIFTPSDSVTQTILGERATVNPYSVEIVTQAWNNLYPNNQYAEIPLTHRYIKFMPTTQEQVYNLYKDDALILFDFPLDYEIIKMGDYYLQPGKTTSDIPDLYAVVDKDYVFDEAIPHEEITQLIKVPYNSMLSAETFRLSNLPHTKVTQGNNGNNGTDGGGDPNDPNDPVSYSIFKPACPSYPCFYVSGIECDDEEYDIVDCYANPDCLPTEPDWPECLAGGGGGGGNGGGGTNSCGCPTFSNKRKSAGCIKVQSPEGPDYDELKKARIIISNNYFGANSWFWNLWSEPTNVDIHGCWKLDKVCHGKIHIWVEFKNDDCMVRGAPFETDGSNDVLSAIRPIRHRVYKHGKSGPNFSNIDIKFNRYTSGLTNTQRIWRAATTINAVTEMHEECNNRSINPPPYIDIYLGFYVFGIGSSATWMAHYGGINGIANPDGVGYMPDIFLTRNGDDGVFKRTAFHEMAHASHFTNVGASWWNVLTAFEFWHGYGESSDQDVGYCSLAESWAAYIGPFFAFDNFIIMENTSFLTLNDGSVIHHIIPGIHWDLDDNLHFGEPDGINPGIPIVDNNVYGFTDEMKFNSMTVDVKSINDFKTKLWNDYHTAPDVTATQKDYDKLFESYGY